MDARSTNRAAVAWRQARSLAALVVFALACTDDVRTPKVATAPGGAILNFAEVSSSHFQQCANGGDGGENCDWINGVLNDSKSAYNEGEVVAQRFVIPNLVAGREYKLVFDWGWEKAVSPGHMNYDFIAGWDVTLGALAGPCFDPGNTDYTNAAGVCNTDGTIKAGVAASAKDIPDAVFTAAAPLGLQTELADAIDRFQALHGGASAVRMDILGGSFPADAFAVNASYIVSGDNVTGRFTVKFTAAQSTVMLLWGGHFADGRDYKLAVWDADKNGTGPETTGDLTGAAGQSGSPFHFTQQNITDLTTNETVGIGSLSNNIQGSVIELPPIARISITPSAVNTVGESHTFTVKVEEDPRDDNLGYRVAAGETVVITLTDANGAVHTSPTGTCISGTTNASGECTVTFTSNSAGTVTGRASSNVVIGAATVPVVTEAVGANTTDSGNDAVKQFVNLRISISPADDDNNVTEDHVLTATVEQDDGLATGGDGVNGWAPVNAATVSFALSNNTAGAVFKPVATTTCQTNTSGQCSVTITSSTAGGVDISASTTVSVSGESITRATGTAANTAAGGSGNAHKDYINGSVAWIKNDGAGNRLGGATFELCRTHTLNTATDPDSYTDITPDVCVTVTDKTPANAGTYSGLDTDGDAGEFKVESLILGKYTVRETAAPTGYNIVNPNAVSAPDHTITPLLNNVTIATPFVNAQPQARISVTPLTDVNEVGDAHTITALVEADDGLPAGGGGDGVAGYAPVSGVLVTFTLNDNSAGAAFVSGVNTCTTSATAPDVGKCSVQINTTTPGVVDIRAGATVTVGSINIPVTTGPNAGTASGDDARKQYVDAQIDLSPLTAVNEVGSAHTITATVQQDDGLATGGDGVNGWASAPNGTTVTFSLSGNTAGAAFVGGVNSCTTTSGSCTVQINTSTPGVVTIHATTTFSISGESVTRATGTGGNNSADATKQYVDAQIDLSPLDEDNAIGENHTLTALVQQDDGLPATGGDLVAGWAPRNGVTVTFAFVTNTIGATFVGGDNDCVTAGTGADAGKCSVQITSTTAGTVTVKATTTFSINGESVTRETGTGGNNSANAQKEWIDGSLKWVKHNNVGQLLAGATFQVCRTHDLNTATDPDSYTDITDVCVTVVDNSAPDTDATGGEFELVDLVLGKYTVRETVAPPGTLIGNPNAVSAPDMTIAAPNVTITTPFVNPPAGRGQIAPTQTTCSQFAAGTAATEPFLKAGVKGGKINNVAPGVVFYFGEFTATSTGTLAIQVLQSATPADNRTGWPLLQVHGNDAQAYVFSVTSSNVCTQVAELNSLSTQPAGSFSAVSGQRYIVQVKFSPSSITGYDIANPVNSAFPVVYRFSTQLGGSSGVTLAQAQVNLIK